MSLKLSILYRGPLSSCNYDCHYCPFAKKHETVDELKSDRLALEKFVDWIESRQEDQLSIFFTPWGEALTRSWYQETITKLSYLPQIEKVVAQTNLSYRLDWLESCNHNKLALWCTYHPSQTTRKRFLQQSNQLQQLKIPHSVGTVGLPEDLIEIESLREELSDEIYLWVNAYKSSGKKYEQDAFKRFEKVDPHFPLNTQYHSSLGRSCRCGSSVISVDGEGVIYRCHFIKKPIGNIYASNFESCLQDTPCTNQSCGCHIGYVHMNELNLYPIYEGGILERIPQNMRNCN